MAAISDRPVKIGVVGVRRGMHIAAAAKNLDVELTALCDIWEEKLSETGKTLNVATYTDFDKFLEHDMDGVIIANYFHEHAPFAIKALKAGKHVLSETSSNQTLAEGVELCREVEKSGKIYMLAENYPFTKFNQEMKRLYEEGEIGEVTYGEGEYNHPMDEDSKLRISPGLNHWRNIMPPTYYNTHALAPLMYITNTMPVKVNGLSIPQRDGGSVRIRDDGFCIMVRMDNGAVFRLFGLGLAGHSIWYRLHGTRGAMETIRGPGSFGPEQIRIWHEEWDLAPGKVTEKVYAPNWPVYGELAQKTGHGGGDFFTNFFFIKAIKENKQPFLDVYRGVAMSSVGILAWKSALEDGAPFEVPDFSDESQRKAYEGDHWSPFTEESRINGPHPSILGRLKPDPEAIKRAQKIWQEIGYKDKG